LPHGTGLHEVLTQISGNDFKPVPSPERVFCFFTLEVAMAIQTARRMHGARRSYVREILKAASKPQIISFAGGLPNPRFIPVQEIREAIRITLAEQGATALQYYASEGHQPLREWIAQQYAAEGMQVTPDQILITTGSQQGLDLASKVLLNPGDKVVVEDPTYIAALQVFGLYEAQIRTVPSDSNGIDSAALRTEIEDRAKLIYCMPNYQNPTGISYTAARRKAVVSAVRGSDAVLLEDDPYVRLRFSGKSLPPMARDLPEQTILLGSFSKIIAPGMRLGWICAPMELIPMLTIAKQSVDLHSENLGQWVIHRLVTSESFESRLCVIREAYGKQCRAMIEAIEKYLPDGVKCTHPDGGMFLWVTLPEDQSAVEVFERAIKKGVAFVPGPAFFANGGGDNMMRLNFSNCDEARIVEGIRRLANAMQ
jgi:2-aminoadipate transaminase